MIQCPQSPGPLWYGFEPDDVGTLGELIRLRSVQSRDRRYVTFLADGNRDELQLTFGELEARAAAVAGSLTGRGLDAGDRVVIVLPSGLDFIVTFCGIQLAGMVAVPLSPPLRLARLEHYLDNLAAVMETAECRAVVVDERLVPIMGGRVESSGRFLLTHTELHSSSAGGDVDDQDPRSLALLQFTSGTTRRPRGVRLLHEQLLAQLTAYCEALRLSPDETVVSWLPLYHDLGLIGKVLACLYAGSHLVLLSPLAFLKDPMSWLRAISRHRGVHTAAPTFAYLLCVRKCTHERLRSERIDLSSLKNAGMGGEPISWTAVQRFRSHFAPFGFAGEALNPCYGLAESTLVVTGHRRSEPLRTCEVSRTRLERRQVSAPADSADRLTLVGNGRPLPGVTVRIAGDGGDESVAGTVGEIWVRGPSLASGYAGDLEATHSSFLDRADGRWLRTGDLGFLHAGDLYVCGRQKDLMIIHGRNLHPHELEQVAEGVDGVRGGGVVAFSIDGDASRGEEVVLVAEIEPRGERTGDHIRRALIEAISSVFQLALADVVLLPKGSVPKTSSGKIQRGLVRSAYVAGNLAALRPAGRLATARMRLRFAALAVLHSAGIHARAYARMLRATLWGGPHEAKIMERGELLDEFRRIAAEAAQAELAGMTEDSEIAGFGIDSLALAEAVGEMERRLDVEVPEHELVAVRTVGQLLDLLSAAARTRRGGLRQ